MNIYESISDESENEKANKKDKKKKLLNDLQVDVRRALFNVTATYFFGSSFHIIHKPSSVMVIMNQRVSCVSSYCTRSITYAIRMGFKTEIEKKMKKTE